jgi:hypothetical protein
MKAIPRQQLYFNDAWKGGLLVTVMVRSWFILEASESRTGSIIYRGFLMKTGFMIQTVWLQVALIGLSFSSLMVMGTSSAHADRVREQPVQIAQSDRWAEQVRRQLIKIAPALGLSGYSLTHNPFIGSLGRGGQEDVTLTMRSGVTYAIVGVCDNDCQDLDLILYDDNGNRVASDVQRDDTPVVKVTPKLDGSIHTQSEDG